MTTLLKKNDLRKYALNKRMSNPFLETNYVVSSKILSNILKNKDYILAKNVALYLPIKNEIDISHLLNQKDKNFYLPRCNNLDLEFVQFCSWDDLITNSWKIPEPKGEKINPQILDIIFIPALIANENNYRIGYGKGFYDRFFKKNNIKAKKIIVISKDFINNDFIQDEFDVRCDYIIHE